MTSVSTQRTAVVVQTAYSPHAQLQPVPVSAVRLRDRFWQPRQQINRQITLPGQYRHCEDTGRIDNFRRASGKLSGAFRGWFFNDSDVYKWLEGVAWELAHGADEALTSMMEQVIDEIAAAQQPDGYLNTYFMFENAGQRWTNTDFHELYCAGHLIQAAIAHHRVTGSNRLLNVAVRFADYICDTFGPADQGKRASSDGHPEIEMALVELYRTTGQERYLEQARFFIDVRGYRQVAPNSFGVHGAEYAQDHLPFRQLDRLYGHAVRALYLNCGAADLFAETGETALLESLQRQWQRMVTRQMYVSGGLGARWEGEAFGDDYELPNWAYAETCAAIASVMWNWRMLILNGDPRYSELIEHTLYNGLISGLSLDGQTYFYQNPLVDPNGSHRRSPWFEVSCCPTNLARFLPSLNQYFYSTSKDGIWVHLYAAGDADLTLSDDRTVRIVQATDYPWDGDITLTVDGAGDFALYLRLPSWCEHAALAVNGVQHPVEAGCYARIERQWQPGDQIHLRLDLPVRRLISHPRLTENQGRAAIFRGPLLYCLEQCDNPDIPLDQAIIPIDALAAVNAQVPGLNGILGLTFDGAIAPALDWEAALYRAASPVQPSVKLRAVPYYAWANREAGPMQVWTRIV